MVYMWIWHAPANKVERERDKNKLKNKNAHIKKLTPPSLCWRVTSCYDLSVAQHKFTIAMPGAVKWDTAGSIEGGDAFPRRCRALPFYSYVGRE